MVEQSPIGTALAAAILHSSEPMVLSDARQPDYPMVVANEAFEALTGYRRDEILGRNCRFLQGADTDEDTTRRISRCILAGQGCIEWIVNHRKNGEAFWNLLFISPVRDRQGDVLFYFGNQLDITKGVPDWLGEVCFGKAHMTREIEFEFHSLLLDILESRAAAENDAATARDQARSLERIVAAARRLAELSTSLAPGEPSPPR